MILRILDLGEKSRGQVCKTELLGEHCTLLRLFDAHRRHSLDLQVEDRQHSEFGREGEMECCLEAWFDEV